MRTSKYLWIKRIVIGTLVATLPQVFLAGAQTLVAGPQSYPASLFARATPPLPGIGLKALPAPSLLDAVELSDAQDDVRFELMRTQMSTARQLERKAAKALDELHRLSASEHFDARQARALADSYAQTQAQLTFNQAQLEAKLRALLTPEQRQQANAARSLSTFYWKAA